TSVRENHLSMEQLAARGITNDTIAASFGTTSKGWVAEQDGHIVAFSIADRSTNSIFALFVLPGHEGKGMGKVLLTSARDWLISEGARTIWLTTGAGTRAEVFYAAQGWHRAGMAAGEEVRFEWRV
ncbi:MAG: GNAT family N-acetyltransferase, partial [Beijerinckiaceae bacterium]